MWLLTLRDVQYRKRQFTIAVLGSAAVFAMALVLAGLSGGFRAEAARTVGETGADAFVLPAGTGGPFTSFVQLPADAVARVRAAQGTVRADPLAVVQQSVRTAGGPLDAHLIGYQPGGLGEPAVGSGRLPGHGQVVADRLTKLHRGDALFIGGHRFVVSGLVSGLSYNAGVPNVYLRIADARGVLFGGRAVTTAVAVRGSPHGLPGGLAVVPAAAARADILRRLANGVSAIDNCQAFLWAVAAVIIGVVTYLTALERRRDFAVLKAIGCTTRRLALGMAAQSTLLAGLAAAVAVAMARLLTPLIPMPLAVPTGRLALLPAVAVAVGLLASLSGLRQAVKADPALAFGGR